MCIAAKSFYRLMDHLFCEVVSGLAFIVLWTRYKKVNPTARRRRRSLIRLVERHVDCAAKKQAASTSNRCFQWMPRFLSARLMLPSRRRSWIRASLESRTSSALRRHLVLLCFSFECRSVPESQEAVPHWITPFGGFRKHSSSNWARTGPGFCQRVFRCNFWIITK